MFGKKFFYTRLRDNSAHYDFTKYIELIKTLIHSGNKEFNGNKKDPNY